MKTDGIWAAIALAAFAFALALAGCGSASTETATGSSNCANGGAAASSSAGTGGGTSLQLDQGCFWGPEQGSPVLRTEAHVKDTKLEFRVCKCEGKFQNTMVDIHLWEYDVTMKEKGQVDSWTQITVDGPCTSWLEVTFFTPGKWLEPRIASPTGTTADLCANEMQCNAQMSLADGVYRSTAFRPSPATP